MNETTGQLQYRVIEKLQFFQQRPKEIFSLLRCFFKCGKETLASHILCKDKEIGIVDIFYIIGQTKCALFTNEMCKKKDFFSRQTKSV